MIALFLVFVKIGCFAFGGGYAVIPLISKFVVEENAWLSMKELIDLISISQMTPGPIAINSATFVGQKVYGLLGSIIATAGFVLPQLVLMLVLGYFLFTKNKKFKILDYGLNGIKAGIVSLIFITALDLFRTSVFADKISFSSINFAALLTFIPALILYYKKVGLFKLIIMGAVCGIVINLII